MHFAKDGLIKTAENKLCISCHKDKKRQMHKSVSGLKMMAKLQKIKLDDNKLNCQSCHSPHGNKISEHFLNSKKKNLLALCASCHGNNTIKLFKDYHNKLGKKR